MNPVELLALYRMLTYSAGRIIAEPRSAAGFITNLLLNTCQASLAVEPSRLPERRLCPAIENSMCAAA